MKSPALIVVPVVFAATLAVAQTLPRAPEYDPASEVTVTGVVTQIHESKVATDHPGLHLILQTETETVEVHACPVRFLRELGFALEVGDKLTVIGSRPKGASVMVAREIAKGRDGLILRDRTGSPNWLPR
jgi:hypothetical protein